MTKKGDVLRAKLIRIMINATYGDILKRVEAAVDPELGADVRRAQNHTGNLVVEVNKAGNDKALMEAMAKAVGTEKVKISRRGRVILEVRGVEEEAEIKDVWRKPSRL